MSEYSKAIAEARSLYESSSDEVRAAIEQIFPNVFGKNYKSMPEKIPSEVIIKMLVQEKKALEVKIGQLESYIEELEALRLNEKEVEALRKENKALRKEYKKSDWYKEIQKTLDDSARKRREWQEAVNRVNLRLMEYEKKYGKLEDN